MWKRNIIKHQWSYGNFFSNDACDSQIVGNQTKEHIMTYLNEIYSISNKSMKYLGHTYFWIDYGGGFKLVQNSLKFLFWFKKMSYNLKKKHFRSWGAAVG